MKKIYRYRQSISSIKIVKAWVSSLAVRSNNVSAPVLPGNNPIVQNHPGYECQFTESASQAIYVFLKGLNPGKVVIPAYTCERVVAAVSQAGHQPVFIDVAVETAIPSINEWVNVCDLETVAIIPTHIFGNHFDLSELVAFCQKNNIYIIEDRALSSPWYAGATGDLHADAIVYSFGRGKPFTVGSGGLLFSKGMKVELPVLKRSAIWLPESLRLVLQSLLSGPVFYPLMEKLGFALRGLTAHKTQLTPGNSAKARFKAGITDGRIKFLTQLLSHYQGPDAKVFADLVLIYENGLVENQNLQKVTGKCSSMPYASFYALRVKNRDKVIAAMSRQGIYLASFYNYSAASVATGGAFPGAELLASEIILLPVNPSVSTEDAKRICQKINQLTGI